MVWEGNRERAACHNFNRPFVTNLARGQAVGGLTQLEGTRDRGLGGFRCAAILEDYGTWKVLARLPQLALTQPTQSRPHLSLGLMVFLPSKRLKDQEARKKAPLISLPLRLPRSSAMGNNLDISTRFKQPTG